MPNKILFVLCEGPHDVAFIYRILYNAGFTTYNLCIKDYPFPLNDYFKKEATWENLEQLKIEEARNRFLPSEVLVSENKNLILLYAIGGDSKIDKRKKLLADIATMYATFEEEKRIRIDSGYICSVLYFFDADSKGRDKRYEEISTELSICLGEKIKISSDSPSYKHVNGITYSGYIFSKPGEQKGKLEDILLPLLKSENEDIFNTAEEYIEKFHDPTRLPRLKIEKDAEGVLVEIRNNSKKNKYEKDKSIIGIASQLQNSGSTNTVCIKYSDYLTKKKITENDSCKEILRVFNLYV